MVNVAITNVTVVVLMAVTGRLGADAQIGYALGARLEYVTIPLAFVFGTALVATVGTNCGAGQHARARRIAWTGGVVARADRTLYLAKRAADATASRSRTRNSPTIH